MDQFPYFGREQMVLLEGVLVDPDFFTFALVGFLAQMVDGALGMAYGVTSTSVLLSFGLSPAGASAMVHIAEFFTTAASGASHLAFRNVQRRLLLVLVPTGVAGGVLGAYVVTGLPGDVMRPLVAAYLGVMGLLVLSRVFRFPAPRRLSHRALVSIGIGGGFVDAIGGGGWGPIVSGNLLSAGEEPRYVVGSVNLAEFFVTAATSTAFVAAFVTGHWEDAGDVASYGWAVGGLIAGGLVAAPFAGWMVRIVPRKILGAAVGLLIIDLAIYQAAILPSWSL